LEIQALTQRLERMETKLQSCVQTETTLVGQIAAIQNEVNINVFIYL